MKLIPLIIISIILDSCSSKISTVRNVYQTHNLPSDSVQNKSFLKLHLKNGNLVILKNWNLDTINSQIIGNGFYYEPNRKLRQNHFETPIAFEDCILAETNDPEGVNVISPFIMTFPTLLGAAAVPCLANPKTCFGSCPTFYSTENDTLKIQAEGFSSSVTKSLEAIDIDYLDLTPKDSIISLVVKNEAHETHYIKNIELLAFSINNNEQVMQSDLGFYKVSNLSTILNPNKDEQIQKLIYRDGNEYFSESDAIDLREKEIITLDIAPQQANSLGIIITERQSLLTTFLFYQSIAYMGSGAGENLANYEKALSKEYKMPLTFIEQLGEIEVEAKVDGKWQKVGELNESGPIVSDRHLLPIEIDGIIDQVRLRMTKGLWRIDEISVANIIEKVDPIVLPPTKLLHNGNNNINLLTKLKDTASYVVNLPGASDTLIFKLPKDENVQLYLKSKGYYIEWMRENWLKEGDPAMVRMMFVFPKKWLREMAPKYKAVEPIMEELFWTSKYTN